DLLDAATIDGNRRRMFKSKNLTSRINLIMGGYIFTTIYGTQQLKAVTFKWDGAEYCRFIFVHLLLKLRAPQRHPVGRSLRSPRSRPLSTSWHGTIHL